jgi:hypothetical protein
MIVVMRRALAGLLLAIVSASGAACTRPPQDPLQLDHNLLTVHNRTDGDWTDVAVWVNHHYRVTTPRIEAGSYFRAPLDAFVEAYGRRFDDRRTLITDVRLTAKRADGEAFELKKQFEKGGLAGALKGLGGKQR